MYPRFFTYSADYPEKVLLLLIRDMGNCPCPRCLVKKSAICALGTPADMKQRQDGKRVDSRALHMKIAKARKLIYQQGYVVNSKLVDDLLKPESLVPTEIVMHIMRLLQAHDKQMLTEFDNQFSQVPPFGRDTIRYLVTMSQCIIPVVEGLLPEPHNSILLDLLFITAYTHGLCMLCMHTMETLHLLEAATIEFGKHVRKFADITCAAFNTTELPKETAARMRRQARKDHLPTASTAGNVQTAGTVETTESGPASTTAAAVPCPPQTMDPMVTKMRTFSLSTWHYVDVIHDYGTTDSYTTQLARFNFPVNVLMLTGEVEHRRAKTGRYMRTSKKNFEEQMAAMDIRDQRIRNIEHKLQLHDVRQSQLTEPTSNSPSKFDEDSESPSNVNTHHVIGISQRDYIDIGPWLLRNQADPATKDFLPRLQDHLLARLCGLPHAGDSFMFNKDERSRIVFRNHRMYPHQTFHINYTTYDVCRDSDLVKSVRPRQNIMLLSKSTTADEDIFHSYWYARVLGIYHSHSGWSFSCPMDGMRASVASGFHSLRLERVGFIPAFDSNAFGFVDPNNVICGCHLTPVFANGRTWRLLGRSWLARGREADDDDWDTFYVNWQVPYVGGAIAIVQTRQSVQRIHGLSKKYLNVMMTLSRDMLIPQTMNNLILMTTQMTWRPKCLSLQGSKTYFKQAGTSSYK
ncbi:GLOBIN domain-containing protein [Salix suchowensis]|nr:GLOBIN domain-containing protein [Salix suchowensis]